jgi:histidinol-phosphate aminotransferase
VILNRNYTGIFGLKSSTQLLFHFHLFQVRSVYMSIKINHKTYQALIFDVDDTLIDTSKSYDQAVKKTVKHFTTTDVTDEQINLVRTDGIAYGVNNDWNVTWLLIQLLKQFSVEQWKAVLTEQVIEKMNPESVDYLSIKAFFQTIYVGNPPFNGQGLIDTAEKKMYHDQFFPTLKQLGVKIAVVTSRPTEEALYTLNHVNQLVGEFIETENLIISMSSRNAAGQLIPEKPSPKPILECVNRLRVELKSCVYIGNSSSDYIAARDAGVDFIQVGTSTIHRRIEPNGFDYVRLDSVNELLVARDK